MGKGDGGEAEEGEEAAEHAVIETIEPAQAGGATEREPSERDHPGERRDCEDGAQPSDSGPAIGRGGEVDRQEQFTGRKSKGQEEPPKRGAIGGLGDELAALAMVAAVSVR